jgi:hypothetical protein
MTLIPTPMVSVAGLQRQKPPALLSRADPKVFAAVKETHLHPVLKKADSALIRA